MCANPVLDVVSSLIPNGSWRFREVQERIDQVWVQVDQGLVQKYWKSDIILHNVNLISI